MHAMARVDPMHQQIVRRWIRSASDRDKTLGDDQHFGMEHIKYFASAQSDTKRLEWPSAMDVVDVFEMH
jgi:hypothetical protein